MSVHAPLATCLHRSATGRRRSTLDAEALSVVRDTSRQQRFTSLCCFVVAFWLLLRAESEELVDLMETLNAQRAARDEKTIERNKQARRDEKFGGRAERRGGAKCFRLYLCT